MALGGNRRFRASRVDLREIENTAAKIPVQGERYPEELQRMTGL